MTSPTNITLYCTVWSWYMRKRIDHWCSVVPEKSQSSGPPFRGETRQASLPTGTVGPRVGIFLSPLNTNDGFYLSHIPKPAYGKDEKRTQAGRMSIPDVIISHLSEFRIFLKPFSCFSQYKMLHLVVSKKENPLFV